MQAGHVVAYASW
jgi:hypothetical protein